MSLSDLEGKIQKRVAEIGKLGKTELSDKAKVAFLKNLSEILKQGKTFEKKHDDLNKRIKEAKSLAGDIDKYVKEWSVFVKDANALAQQGSKLSPDTKSRDYFMIATLLTQVGSANVLDDYP